MDEAAETNSLSNNIPTECPTLSDFDFVLIDVQIMPYMADYGTTLYQLYCTYDFVLY